ncbi:hypothetical protein [Legionella londiniensis]|uniref:Coiled coil protein n=1 Tax=Legionella londiniensis TaxID=45068 RepID=A0A0W0VQG4_9GAMM|nr:hypothetical protein [Legionella londiniensis]KTD22411.1 coiled coil protein [Legionella londiniensis]STX93015.1 coiled coil protein [Legionella londiniensis]
MAKKEPTVMTDSKTNIPPVQKTQARQPESMQKDLQSKTDIQQGPAKLEQWFANIIQDAARSLPQSQIKSDPLSLTKAASELISLYGFKSPEDTRNFFLRPESDSIKKRMSDKIVFEHNLEEAQRIRLQDEEIRKSRFLAFLLHLLLSKKKANAQSLNEYIQQQIDNRLHTKTANKPASATGNNKVSDTWTKSYQELNHKLQAKNAKLTELDNQIESLEALIENIETEYSELLKSANQSDNEINAELKDYAANLNALLAPSAENQPTAVRDKTELLRTIDLKIQSLKDKADDIVKNIIENPEILERDPLLKTKMNTLFVEAGAWEDLKSVLKGNKNLCNENGQETHSLFDAKYYVSKDQKLHKDEKTGKFYLLQKDQDFDLMTEDEKAKAHEKFVKHEPELKRVSELVTHNKSLVLQEIDSQLKGHMQEKEKVLLEKKEIESELQLLARKQAVLAYEQSQGPKEQDEEQELKSSKQLNNQFSKVMTPTPKPSVNIKQKLDPAAIRDKFVSLLNTIRNNPSAQAMDGLRDALTEAAKNNPELKLALRDFRGHENLQGETFRLIMELTKSMKAEHMQPLMSSLEKIAATKPEPQAPNPFNMTPKFSR